MPAPKNKVLTIALTCLGALVLLAVLCGGGIYFGWDSFLKLGEKSDLDGYQRAIRGSVLPPTRRSELLAQVDRIRAAVDRAPIGFPRWVEHDQKIEEFTKRQRITSENDAALERELDALEREFR